MSTTKQQPMDNHRPTAPSSTPRWLILLPLMVIHLSPQAVFTLEAPQGSAVLQTEATAASASMELAKGKAKGGKHKHHSR